MYNEQLVMNVLTPNKISTPMLMEYYFVILFEIYSLWVFFEVNLHDLIAYLLALHVVCPLLLLIFQYSTYRDTIESRVAWHAITCIAINQNTFAFCKENLF